MATGDSAASPSNGDELNGWKEIAVYLGKSVRAAQRWERKIGLPIHRIKTVAGQIVFARKSEIEAWKRTAEVPRDEPDPEPAPGGDAGTGGGGVSPRRGAWMMPAIVVASLVIVALALVIVRGPSVPPERPVRFQLVGQELEARDGKGDRIWAHRFPADVTELSPEFLRPQLRPVQVDDLDGDGHREIVVVVQQGAASNRTTGVETIDVFSEDGRLRWSYAPSATWTFAGRRFDGPWVVLDLLIAGPPDARRIWVAYGHHTSWPGFVVRLDLQGRSSVQFVQSGLVYGLGYWTHAGRSYVLAAGVNNEYASASVAVLDADGSPAVSPQSVGSADRCDNCPKGAPARYYLLPPSELSRLSALPYNRAIAVGASVSSVEITTEEWRTRDVATMYRLSASLDPESVDFTDGYWSVHRELEAAGRIAHAAENCPERTEPKIVREWMGGDTWREIDVPVRLALPPGSAGKR